MSFTSCTTLCYKVAESIPIHCDIHCPSIQNTSTSTSPGKVPAVVYFHGGGLTVGDRRSYFPDRVIALGYAFVSADYRLMPPASGHEIIDDIKDLFDFLVQAKINVETHGNDCSSNATVFRIDSDAIAVAGTSSGGLCTYLAAAHCVSPKPKALLSMYGMGGNFFTSNYLMPKTKPFFRQREILNPSDFQEYLYPLSTTLKATAASPLAYHPSTHPFPGSPANPRMFLARLYLQIGNFIDYYTGEHNPSLSAILRPVFCGDSHQNQNNLGIPDHDHVARLRALLPERSFLLFPQLSISSTWPPTMLLHGSADTAVSVTESQNLYELLRRRKISVELRIFDGKEHSFDYEPGAEQAFESDFDGVAQFLKSRLGPKGS